MRSSQYPNGHRLRRKTNVVCCMVGCTERAEWCEYSTWSVRGTRHISFFNYCASCWEKPSPGGDRSTPRERAMRKEDQS
jgi:hypothetical protein